MAKLKNNRSSRESVLRVFHTLHGVYPGARTELKYEDPFQLLVAVILSAQCTDDRVNQVTPILFAKYPGPRELSSAKSRDVEKIIHSCGFFRAKSKSIIGASQSLVENFNGEVPKTLEDLVTLRGVGRKTASVVLNQAFDIAAIAVDTHVKRVSNRLGWAGSSDPTKIEFELRDLVPMDLWAKVNSLLILHGRRICRARKPLCGLCPVRDECLFHQIVSRNLNSPDRWLLDPTRQ